jgi:hypothetical protein
MFTTHPTNLNIFCGFFHSLQTNTRRQLFQRLRMSGDKPSLLHMPLWYIEGKFTLAFYFKRILGQCIQIGLNHFPNCYWFPFIFMYFGTLWTSGVALRVLSLTPLLRLEISPLVCTLFTETVHRLLKVIEDLLVCELCTDVTGRWYRVCLSSLK